MNDTNYYICTNSESVYTDADFVGNKPVNLIQLTDENGFGETRPISPSEYAAREDIPNITDNITIENFDEDVADVYGLWNYPLSEYQHVRDEDRKVVVVKFNEGYRLVELSE